MELQWHSSMTRRRSTCGSPTRGREQSGWSEPCFIPAVCKIILRISSRPPRALSHDVLQQNHAIKIEDKERAPCAREHLFVPQAHPFPLFITSLSLLTKFRSSLEISFCCLWLSCWLGCSHLRVPCGEREGWCSGRQERKGENTILRGGYRCGLGGHDCIVNLQCNLNPSFRWSPRDRCSVCLRCYPHSWGGTWIQRNNRVLA